MKTHIFLCMVLVLFLFGSPYTKSAAQAAAVMRFQDGAFPGVDYDGTQDTYLNEGAPLTNYGAATTLYGDGDDPAEADYGRTESAIVLRWDISAIPPGSRVARAQMTLYINVRSQRPWPVYALYNPWNESQASWLRPASGRFWNFSGTRNPYDRSPSPIATIPSQSALGFLTVDLDAAGMQMVQQWVNQPESNHGLVIADWLNAANVIGVASSEAVTVNRRPMLLVEYDPPAAQNTQPAAAVMTLSTPEDTALIIQPGGSDADGDPLVYRIITPPSKGQLVPLGTRFLYRPTLHSNGADSFTYAASDGRLESAPAQATINVQPVNDAPFPSVSASVWNGVAPLSVSFTASAVDVDSPPGASFSFQWDFANGSTGQGQAVSHTFSSPGIYPVKLKAVDSGGAVGETTYVITVRDPASLARRPNVILFVGDGMGIAQVRAAGMYGVGKEGTLTFERFQHQALMETRSASTQLTDSAASATAMATGYKVNNKVISLAIPGDGRDLFTVLEAAKERGQSTGLITTNGITDATPAAFAAHTADRENEDEIASDYLTQSRPNVLFGAGAYGMTHQAALDAGYQLVTNRAEMLALNTETAQYVSGQFGVKPLPYEVEWSGDRPHLSEMTETALKILDNDPDGFFLLVENENTDRAAHIYDLPKVVHEVLELDRAVAKALEWAKTHPNTMIVVLADHETSGLVVQTERGKGNYPDAGWTTLNHTAQDVMVYATGVWANQVSGFIDNTDIASILQGGTFNRPPSVSLAASLTAVVGQPVQVTGQVSDDGLPQGSALAYQWSVAQGNPAHVEFSTPNAATTQVTFRFGGSYTLRIQVSDGEFTRAATLQAQVEGHQFEDQQLPFYLPMIRR